MKIVNFLLAGLYYVLKGIVIVTLRIFYPRMAVINRERLRQKGPAIIVVNHPNTLLDALIAAASVRGMTFFLANYSLFKNPVTNWLLNRLYCIPIQRYQDTDGKPLQNDDSFDRADTHLAGGGMLLLAPEGASLPGRRIRPFKTGAARIALSAESKAAFNLNLVFVPIGLSYERPHRFGGSVVIHAGEPIPVDGYAGAYAGDPMQTVRDITQLLEEHMKNLVIHTADDPEDKLLHRVEILLQNSRPLPLADAYRRAREVLDWFRRMQSEAPEEWSKFSRDVRAYFARLSALGLQDHAVTERSFSFLLRDIPALWLALPVFAFGWAANAPAFHLPGFIAGRAGAVPEYQSTWKYVAGLVLFPIWYAVLFNLLEAFLPTAWCWVVILLAPFAGLAAWRYFKWALHTWQSFNAWRRIRRNPEMKQEWRVFRESIMEKLSHFL